MGVVPLPFLGIAFQSNNPESKGHILGHKKKFKAVFVLTGFLSMLHSTLSNLSNYFQMNEG